VGAGGCCVDKDKKNMDASLRWKEQLLLKEKLLLEKKAFLEHRISKAKRAIAVFEESILDEEPISPGSNFNQVF
jgi:hypothetical protein